MDTETFRYAPRFRAEVEPALSQFGVGQGSAEIDAYFEALLANPDARHDAVFVTRDKAGSLGIGALMSRPILGGHGRMLNMMMPQDNDAKAIPFGTSLFAAAAAFARARGIFRLGILVRDEQNLLQAYVDSTGLVPVMPHHAMGWNGAPIPLPVPDTDGIILDVYEGGNPATNAGISALWEWAFRRDPIGPVLTPEMLEDCAAHQDIWFVVARDPHAGRVVGVSEAGPGNFFSGIAVARSHWGTSLAEALSAATMNEFIARGHTSLHSMVRKTNRASVALHERMNWQITGGGNIYVTPPPAG